MLLRSHIYIYKLVLALAIQQTTQCPDYYFDLQWMKWWDCFLGLEGTTLEREREPDVMYIWRLPHADSHTDTKELKKEFFWIRRVEGAQKGEDFPVCFRLGDENSKSKASYKLDNYELYSIYRISFYLSLSLSLLYRTSVYSCALCISLLMWHAPDALERGCVCHNGAIRIANNLV